ncbi:unnamed protein product [Candidula unifasciata]|uniref:DUF4604 domain-containing protein n=1 Tax=Candidula unifasciata TaxID=100452 RepID=A0A8S3ZI84_9EUPU|nr:unnamed protein product [Candidula unifasciata]
MPRNGVQYVNNEEPAFIQQFKEKIGYKEGPSINSKRNMPNFDDHEDEEDEYAPEKEDEKPVVVVVKSGDLTAEEAHAEQKLVEDGPARLDEKITFKKPVKRTKEPPEDTAETEDGKKKPKKPSDKGKQSSGKMTKNTNLLSFGDEDADEG